MKLNNLKTMKLFVVLTLFVIGTHQQEIKCQTVFMSDRGECTFTNLKSFDDFVDVAKNYTSSNQAVTIKIEQSKIKSLPNKMFSSFYYVANLAASNIGLEEIVEGVFQSKKWMTIVLSNNSIKKLTGKIFSNMSVKLLDLSNNQIESIDDDVFSGIEAISLKLSNNKIISTSFVNTMSFFNSLELDSNEIVEIGTIMQTPKTWKTTMFMFGITYPKLVLAGNKIKKFNCDSQFKLSVVSLQSNLELTEVILNDCNIVNLNIAKCGNLKTITLNDKLENLDAEINNLKSIDLKSAKNLTQLDLSNNSLTPESIQEVLQLGQLLALDLSHNFIGELNVSTFHKLNNVISMKLQATKISNIEFGTFSHQHNLKLLDISDNNLKTFDMNMLLSMSNLMSLDLGGNQLTKLENIEGHIFTLPLMKLIDISKNNWTCSYLMSLIKRFQLLGVSMQLSEVVTHETNIKGIGCTQDAAQPVNIDLIPLNNNITNDHFNEIVTKFNSESVSTAQFKQNMENRLASMERTLKQYSNQGTNAIASPLKNEQTNIQIKNSRLMDITYIVAALFFIVFIALKIVEFVKVTQMTRTRPMRTVSENPLADNFEQF